MDCVPCLELWDADRLGSINPSLGSVTKQVGAARASSIRDILWRRDLSAEFGLTLISSSLRKVVLASIFASLLQERMRAAYDVSPIEA